MRNNCFEAYFTKETMRNRLSKRFSFGNQLVIKLLYSDYENMRNENHFSDSGDPKPAREKKTNLQAFTMMSGETHKYL